jgi:hypothetical protein
MGLNFENLYGRNTIGFTGIFYTKQKGRPGKSSIQQETLGPRWMGANRQGERYLSGKQYRTISSVKINSLRGEGIVLDRCSR